MANTPRILLEADALALNESQPAEPNHGIAQDQQSAPDRGDAST